MVFIGRIYKIENLVTHQCYVGQTTKNVEERWAMHIYTMDRKKYRNYKLYQAMREYGIDNFTISDLQIVAGKTQTELQERMDEMEKYWIDNLNAMENGYNATSGGIRSYKFDEKTKSKMATKNQWKWAKVDVYKLDGTFLKTYDSYALASADLGIRAEDISNIATKRSRHRSIKGYRFANHGEKLTPYKINVEKHFAKYGE